MKGKCGQVWKRRDLLESPLSMVTSQNNISSRHQQCEVTVPGSSVEPYVARLCQYWAALPLTWS